MTDCICIGHVCHYDTHAVMHVCHHDTRKASCGVAEDIRQMRASKRARVVKESIERASTRENIKENSTRCVQTRIPAISSGSC